MTIEQTRRRLNQLDKELIDLERKLAEETRKEADKTKRINDTQRSITKNTSDSMKQSKMRQIQGYQNELVKILTSKADFNKKTAEKKKKQGEESLKLRREEIEERKRNTKEMKTVYNNYDKHIAELNAQLKEKITTPEKATTNLYSVNDEEYDIFISHASEDKESLVDELYSELCNKDIRVWYDTLNITWGDSLRSKIDQGLKKSKFGIVIISKDYIKKGWTQYELDGLFQREMTDGKIILPIWHRITKKEVQEFSPTMAGRLALNTTLMTPAEIAVEIEKMLSIGN